MGRYLEVMTTAQCSNGPPVKKLDKDSYLDLRSGEVRDYVHGSTRADSLEGIRRTLAHIRALINTNVTDPSKCLWVTLTYKENMTDTKKLYRDYRDFWKRFCYWCKKKGYPKPDYIAVEEPQGRGAWHVHAFFIWDTKAPYVPNNEVMETLWPHGFTKTKALQDVDNVGAYFSAYLGDMPLEEFQELPQEQQDQLTVAEVKVCEFTDARELTKEKRFVKGGRLPLYPAGMNIVRRSKGIKDPTVEHMDYAQAQKKVSSAKPTFSCSYEIVGDFDRTLNKISKTYYTMPELQNQHT